MVSQTAIEADQRGDMLQQIAYAGGARVGAAAGEPEELVADQFQLACGSNG